MSAQSPKALVRSYFVHSTKGMSPAIQRVILEDVDNLLTGGRGEYLERQEDLRKDFLTICESCLATEFLHPEVRVLCPQT